VTELRYTKDHEWVSLDGDIATIGISQHAQEQLGDVVYVELPQRGRAVSKGGNAAVVESVKAASEVYAPLSGEVVEVNAALEADPALVNRAAETEGWFMKVKIKDRSELDELMDSAAYQKFVESL
jgi:glycine cleavage system H protein